MRVFLLCVSLPLLAISLSAAPCVLAPYSTYLVAGFECEVDSAVFNNFDFQLQNDSSDTVALTPAQIDVSPLSFAGEVGLRFAGDFEALGAPDGPGVAEGIRNITYRFFFDVTRPGSQFTAVTAVLNDPVREVYNVLKFGNIFASNQAANDGALAIADDDDPDLSDTVILNSPRLLVVADELLHLTAGASAPGTMAPVGFASASSADYLFAYEVIVPEPGTWTTLFSGAALLSALGLVRSRRRA